MIGPTEANYITLTERSQLVRFWTIMNKMQSGCSRKRCLNLIFVCFCPSLPASRHFHACLPCFVPQILFCGLAPMRHETPCPWPETLQLQRLQALWPSLRSKLGSGPGHSQKKRLSQKQFPAFKAAAPSSVVRSAFQV